MDMKVSLESLYLKHFEHVGISIIYEKVNRCEPPGRGFAIIQNLGPDTYLNNNGQTVILIAPTVGNNNTWKWEKCGPFTGCIPTQWIGGYSAFLNNGMTDKHYFLQVGLYFTNRDHPVDPLLIGNIELRINNGYSSISPPWQVRGIDARP
jgi:hypothetical protein